MAELNEDGLVAGQQVDFATLKRIENNRKESKTEVKPSQGAKRGTKTATH